MRPQSVRTAYLLFLILGLSVAQAGMRQVARGIVVPEFKAEEATPAAVFEQVRTLSKTLDPDKQGVNFVFQMTADGKNVLQQPGITMQLSNISVEKLVEYACLAAGLHYRFDENAIIIADRALPENGMSTRVFNVAPGVVDPERTRPKAKSIDWRK